MLAYKRKKKLQINTREPRKTLIPKRVSIHDRPETINKKSDFGRLDTDLTFCKEDRSVNFLILTKRVIKMSFFSQHAVLHKLRDLVASALRNT